MEWSAIFGIFPSNFGEALVIKRNGTSQIINPDPCASMKLRRKMR